MTEASDETPSYILPIFFTSKTQELFQCTGDEQVTEEEPFKLIPKDQILQDYKDRAAISDFYPAKKIVENYPADDLLVVYDPNFKYGQNFYLITDDEQKELLLNPPVDEAAEEALLAEEAALEVRIGLHTPQPWISLGSEFEVEDEMIVESREKMKFTIQRERKEFGSHVTLSDRSIEEDEVIECVSFEDDSFFMMKEIDKAIQSISDIKDVACQTAWPCPRNANTQYEARFNESEENEEIMASSVILDFLTEVVPRFELALQQNETLDVFINDYTELGEEDSTFGSKADNHLKEYQSFTDLQFSKNKTISSIQWHPTIKGLIAVSCIEKMSFYERIDNSSKCLMTPSLILIWSFADPIHPLLLLEAPDDILCFKFNPCDPNIICGGCLNGQIVLWDISKHADLLKNHRNSGSNTNQNMTNLPSFFQTNNRELSPMIRYCAVSNIENSHRMAISDIQWLPNHIEIGRMGVVNENKSKYCSQIITCSADGTVLFWDIKATKSAAAPTPKNRQQTINKVSIFQHLDLTWKPILKVTVTRMRGSGELNPLKFIISETQKLLKKSDTIQKHYEEEQEEPQLGGMMMSSSKKKEEPKQLDNINTKFHVATEDGELVYLDWKPTKDIDTGKIVSSRPEFCTDAHDGSINTLQKSPFIKDIILTVGGWTFSIWKEGVTVGPLFESHSHECELTCGHWSPSRAGVIFIGKADGNVDIWDLLDKSHEPFLTQNVTPVPVLAIYPYQISGKQQLLAAGDEVGTLHIMEVPWNLRHASSNELSIVENYLEREASRIQMYDLRRSEKHQTKGLGTKQIPEEEQPNEQELDEEWEVKAKVEFQDYLAFERRLLEELGVAVPHDDDD